MNRRLQLRHVAAETVSVLPDLLAQLAGFDAAESTLYHLKDLAPLDPNDCPGIAFPSGNPLAGQKGTRIRVYNKDTFDTALQLQPGTNYTTVHPSQGAPASSDGQEKADEGDTPAKMTDSNPADPSSSPPQQPLKPVCVLNLASEKHAGGGWLNGALAQEEALCYRSSLSLSLHKTYYPLPTLSAIFSPSVLLLRTSLSSGHTLLHPWDPVASLPITSVISVAGLRHPAVTSEGKFKDDVNRETTKSKIRLTLRVAAREGHRKLVLGALGCGVFGNPSGEVAECFLEVLREEEFQGGWWEDVVFAILDNVRGAEGGKDGSGNYGVFYRALDGQVV
ncbi:hypothetical protein BU26DRAFT_517132 [Trematosphaeria pertusa]|uniref:Microbial-type PARG catalytic domain-containing protein n=1 Tax=Trematosphaeria pertusa TaxID=390896 RepID=A0A6A6IR23_9PLEO|nr:uncharacterized protein BU26DRAFT_517132 [Trematosphaeria pertusa]KAF2252528.1 hypothetical protein BU26DRAFT_517132 [Trematosphaeria pertusa]